RFERERTRIRAALGDRALSVEHIGSTAVPGLAAKPIVDILVELGDPGDEALVPTLAAAGYELRVHEPRHRMFRTPARDVHVHVWPTGSAEGRAYLELRDRLRTDPLARARYEQVKRELAGRPWPDMNYYAEAKGPVIAQILAGPE
ncbi:MAG TPA: GrpB family protein, partial [Gaiellales bacterium]